VARVISMTQGDNYEALLPIIGLKRVLERPGIWRPLLIIILIKMRISKHVLCCPRNETPEAGAREL